MFLVFVGGILVLYILVVRLHSNVKIVIRHFRRRASLGLIACVVLAYTYARNWLADLGDLKVGTLYRQGTGGLLVFLCLFIIVVLLVVAHYSVYFKGALVKFK